jgi:long-chain acyl-CoA synthetase
MPVHDPDGSHGLRAEVHHGRVVRCYAERPAGVYAMFEAAEARAPDSPAVVDGDLRLTYAQLGELSARAALRLHKAGVQPGDRVAVLLDNRADMLAALLAIARLGAVSVPMNIRQRRPETAYAVNDCGAVVLIHEAALAEQTPSAAECPSLRARLEVDDAHRLWAAMGEEAAPPPAPVGEDEPFCILYTSGTTGRPKGAVLTNFGAVNNCLAARYHLGLEEGEGTILAVPASHVTGLLLVQLLMVCVAGKTVMQRGFKAKAFLDLVVAERMTFAILVPAMYTLCLMEEGFAARDLSAWRTGAYGGAPMPQAIAARLSREAPNLRLFNIYGATETTSPAVIMPYQQTLSRLGQVGLPLAGYDLVIMDDEGRQLAPGRQGEIWIAGAGVIPAYWGNPEATQASFVGGYWKSGDLGSVDADGYVTLLDRKKDVINRGGFKIYSVEVENTLVAHAAVLEAGVVGRPCPVLGERVEAFVVLSASATESELRAYCAENLSDYKVPDHVRVVEGPLPRNPNGKLLKTALRKWCEDLLPDDAPAARSA